MQSWASFEGWHTPDGHGKKLSWEVLDTFQSLASRYFQQQCSELPGLLKRWDETLIDFGGDPCRTDWSNFRPLRLSREEDWSDWLTHLLQNARTADLADALFPELDLLGQVYQAPKVTREEATADYRADLIIRWDATRITHLEVKLWDLNFQKTFPTCIELREKLADGQSKSLSWSDYILIPSESQGAWSECQEAAEFPIQETSWETVAVALRRALVRRKEALPWLAVAFNFCGAIEQKILGIPRLRAAPEALPSNNPVGLARLADLLKGGLET